MMRGLSEPIADGYETNRGPCRSTNGSRVISPSPETSRICRDTRYDVGKSGTGLSEKTTRIYRVEIEIVERDHRDRNRGDRNRRDRDRGDRDRGDRNCRD